MVCGSFPSSCAISLMLSWWVSSSCMSCSLALSVLSLKIAALIVGCFGVPSSCVLLLSSCLISVVLLLRVSASSVFVYSCCCLRYCAVACRGVLLQL